MDSSSRYPSTDADVELDGMIARCEALMRAAEPLRSPELMKHLETLLADMLRLRYTK